MIHGPRMNSVCTDNRKHGKKSPKQFCADTTTKKLKYSTQVVRASIFWKSSDRIGKDLKANGGLLKGTLIMLSRDFAQTLPIMPRSVYVN